VYADQMAQQRLKDVKDKKKEEKQPEIYGLPEGEQPYGLRQGYRQAV